MSNFNLILDPLTHSQHLKFLIPNSLYYTEDNESSYPPGHYSLDVFENKFGFSFSKELEKIQNTKKFSNLFMVLPILSLNEEHEGPRYNEWIKKFIFLYNKYKNSISGKFIIFDNHGCDYDPSFVLKYLEPDIIFKRVFTNRKYEIKNIYPYPFIMCTINDPFFHLLNKERLEPVNKINKILWCGSLFRQKENIKDLCDEFCDRESTIKKFKRRYNNLLDIRNVPYDQFLDLVNSYKYTLDLRGYSRLNKRLFEIITTNSLLLAEKIDVNWGFEEGDSFSEECFFEQGNIRDLFKKYKELENNEQLYNKCLKNQKYITNKYFNNKFLWDYIKNKIE